MSDAALHRVGIGLTGGIGFDRTPGAVLAVGLVLDLIPRPVMLGFNRSYRLPWGSHRQSGTGRLAADVAKALRGLIWRRETGCAAVAPDCTRALVPIAQGD